MAYHTRRSGPQGMGRGIPPPMMFQQQRSNNRTPTNFGGNRNGNSIPPPNNYQGNASQSQSNNTNYAQQPQTQQQVQPQTQQKVQPQTQQKVQPQSQQQVQPSIQNPVKQEPGNNEDQMQSSLSGALAPPPPPPATLLDPNNSLVSDTKIEEPKENLETKTKPWMKNKVPGFKINKKIKRRRQNARLRKLLQPKNAIMVLNELKTGIKFSFQESSTGLSQKVFVVNAEVDGKRYIGQGMSKPLAKQNAAENALRDLLCQKMCSIAMKSEEPETVEEMNIEMTGIADDNEALDETPSPEDDLPWGSLASFALYKLFTEWQNAGNIISPVGLANQLVKPVAQSTPSPAPMRKLPDNPTDRHPVMLLNQLRPGVEFRELSREGMPPNVVFTLSVSIDGFIYKGVAKNKKDAKKEVAKAALAGSFNIKYD